jgi:chloramphenicol-sensitive protein RarD
VMPRGVLAAALAFVLWGVVPIYWKQMQEVSAFELIAHRILWSILFLAVVMAWRKSFAEIRPAFTHAKIFGYTLIASLLLTANWTIYVWSVNAGHVIETSLGYFLTPLFNVVLGFWLLHERLRPVQWVSVGCAAAGVLLLLLHAGSVPWIALSLATTWGLYGILKKRSELGSIAGLTFETLLLAPFAAAFLIWKLVQGQGSLGHVSAGLHAYMIGLGIVSTVPLLLFAYGAQRIRLVTLGLLQYIAPTAQFLIGLYLYREPFDAARLQACLFIWFGLLLYSADSVWSQRFRLLPSR